MYDYLTLNQYLITCSAFSGEVCYYNNTVRTIALLTHFILSFFIDEGLSEFIEELDKFVCELQEEI